MDRRLIERFIDEQDGVLSRRQVLSAGFDDDFIDRQIRRRHWARVHAGVYVNHTGPLTWNQRAWAAVLFYWPAALCGHSALQPTSTQRRTTVDDEPVIHVAIEHPRNAVQIDGVRLHRLMRLGARTRWNLSPPRLQLEEAVLDVCAEAADRAKAFAIAADACQQRRTTPLRLMRALDGRKRLRHGTWLRSALADTDAGALSVLERAYLRRVERRHGLPRGRRQLHSRTTDGVVYRDVEYEAFGLVVELDGRVGHEHARDRWKDMDRDLLAAVHSRLTVRLGWGQVERRACMTAGRIGRLLQLRGWRGVVTRCGPDCAAPSDEDALPGRSSADPADDQPDKEVS